MVQFDLPDLEQVLARMNRFDQTADDVLAELDKRIADLHVTWSGEAAQAQKDAHEKWMRGAQEMRDGLAQLHAAGAVAHNNYSAAIEAGQRMWGG